MKYLLPFLLPILALAAGCEKTVCEEAWDIQRAAIKEACQNYDDCCYCDCALRGDCECNETMEFDMKSGSCGGEKKDRAEGCVDFEDACHDAEYNTADMMCSSQG